MEVTAEEGTNSVTKDSEISVVFDFPLSFSVGFERSLPSLDPFSKEYRDATEERAHFQLELDHASQMADDLQLELNYYQTALEQKTRVNQMEIESQQLCSIEENHKKLTNAIQTLEEKLMDQEKETEIELIEHSSRKLAQTDEKDFQEKLNELQSQFQSELETMRKNLEKKEDKLKKAKDQAELEHSKRKEELRKSLANRMKSDSRHIECRSTELDLKKKATRLEKEIQQLEQQKRSKRKLPLSFTTGESPRMLGVSPQTPNDSKNNNNKGVLTPHPEQIRSAAKYNLPRGVTPKRQLFSLKRTEYPDN